MKYSQSSLPIPISTMPWHSVWDSSYHGWRIAPRCSVYSPSHLKFLKMNGLFRLNALPEEMRTATEVYLLIQRPSVRDRVNIDEIKLACTSRLALVHRLVLKGVPFRLLEKSSLSALLRSRDGLLPTHSTKSGNTSYAKVRSPFTNRPH